MCALWLIVHQVFNGMIEAFFAIVSITLILSLIVLFFVNIDFSAMLHKNITNYFSIAVTILMVTVISEIGLFEANGIQFGMDQLLEVLATQFSTFVHWYFLVMHLGQQTVFDVLLKSLSALFSIPEKCINLEEQYLIITVMDMILVLSRMICVLLVFTYFNMKKAHV